MNIRILVVTHGELGAAFTETVSDIMGRTEEVEVFGVVRGMPADDIRAQFEELLGSMLEGSSAVLVLTDMPGGTPANISVPRLDDERVEVITGLNLPMLLTAIHRRSSVKDIRELSGVAASAGAKGVVNFREALR